jgi:hypothetical protein
VAPAIRPGYNDIVATGETPFGLADKVERKLSQVRPQLVSPRTPTVVFSGKLSTALPLVEPLKFTWVRGGSTTQTNVGLAAEQVAGLMTLREPDQQLYRLVPAGRKESTLRNTSAIYVLADPAEWAALLSRLAKHQRQRAAKQFAESLVAGLLGR